MKLKLIRKRNAVEAKPEEPKGPEETPVSEAQKSPQDLPTAQTPMRGLKLKSSGVDESNTTETSATPQAEDSENEASESEDIQSSENADSSSKPLTKVKPSSKPPALRNLLRAPQKPLQIRLPLRP